MGTKAKLYLIRSLPGGGKTFLARQLCKKFETAKMFAADDYFMSGQKYKFDASKLGLAHDACYQNTRNCLDSGNISVVHNTFTTYQEIKRYLELVDEFNCDYAVLEPDTEWCNNVEECFKMNTHAVPLESIIRMKNRWQTTDEILKLWQADRNKKNDK